MTPSPLRLDGIVDPSGGEIGFADLPPPERIVYALPLDNGPVLLDPGLVLYVADPQGGMVTQSTAVWVDRLILATTTINSRGL